MLLNLSQDYSTIFTDSSPETINCFSIIIAQVLSNSVVNDGFDVETILFQLF